jgi:hypothetical protein
VHAQAIEAWVRNVSHPPIVDLKWEMMGFYLGRNGVGRLAATGNAS